MKFLKYIIMAVVLPGSTAALAQGVSNKGKEFWVGYGHHQFMAQGNNTQNMVLYLSNTENQIAEVTVTIDSSGNPFLPPGFPGGPWTKKYYIQPNSVIESHIIPKGPTDAPTPADASYDARFFEVEWPAGNGGAGLFRRRTVHIVSNIPIVAYAHIYGSASSGATMLMPVTAWGYNYTSVNSEQQYGNNCYNWMYVIASKDNTVVEITPSVKTKNQHLTGFAPGVSKEITLMKGQAYQVIGALLDSDVNGVGGNSSSGYNLTGTTVRSIADPVTGECYPIAVFAGSSRTSNPACSGGTSGDNDNQQLFPQHAWGKKYLTAPFSVSGSANQFMTSPYKIAVPDPATVVKRNGTQIPLGSLINNRYYYFESNTADYIEADTPIMVTQFMSSGCIPSGVGDPEMVVVAPVEQAINQVGFYRNTKESISVNYVTLVVPTIALPSLRIDGSFTFDHTYPHPRNALTGKDYTVVVKRWNANKSQVLIKCDSAFNAITYGLGSVESYAYSAGANINNLNSKTGIHNMPDTANGTIHQYNCVNTPTKLSILLRYRAVKIDWDLAQFAASGTAVPALGNTFSMDPADGYLADTNYIVDGTSYYKYDLPHTFTFHNPGIYDFPVTVTSPGITNCGNKENLYVTVEVKDKPLVNNFNINHPTRCTKDTVYLSAPSSALSGLTPMPLIKWEWFLPGGANGYSKDTAIILPPGINHITSLSGITNQYCITDTVDKNLDVYAPPTTMLSAAPDTVCLGQATTFTQTPFYGYNGVPFNNFYWDFGDGSTPVNTNTNIPQTYTYTSSANFTAKAAVRISGLCISDTATKVVVVNDEAKISGITLPTACLPTNGIAYFSTSATAAGGTPIATYAWDFGNSTTANTQNASTTYSASGTYTGKLTITTTTGCSGDSTFQINIKKTPSVAVAAVAPVCSGDSVTISASGADNYTWSGPGLGATTGSTVKAAPVAGVHSFSVVGSKDGCDTTITFNVTINPRPAKPAVISPINYCQNGATSQLTATGSGGTLMWYDNPTLNNGTTTAPTPSTATAGTFSYYVREIDGGSCEGDTATINVIVNPSITNNTITADETICAGGTAAIINGANAAGGNGTFTYQWQQSTDGGTTWTDIAGATAPTYDPQSPSATTQYRRIAYSGLCTDTSNIVTVTVQPGISNFNIAASQTTVCEGVPFQPIDGQAPTGGTGTYNYIWESSTDGINWTVISGATGEDYQPGVLTVTTHFRRKTDGGQCTATSNTVIITVNPNADGNIALIGSNSICQYDAASIQFTATAGTAPYEVVLTVNGPGGALPPITTTVNNNGPVAIPVLPPGSAAGNYTIIISSLQNSNGCIRTTGFTPVTIEVTATPVVTAPAVSPICEGASATLTASGAANFDWTAPGYTATGSSISVSPTITTTYTVVGKTNGCNSSPVDVTVTVNPKPGKPTVTSPVTYCEGDVAAALSATASGAGNTLTWYNSFPLTGGSSTAPTPSTATAGTFNYYVNETNAENCAGDTSIITVVIAPAIANNTISSDQTLCAGTASAALTGATATGGTGTYNYQWQLSADGGSSWSDIPGATSQTYDAGTLAVGTYKYRRNIASGLCSNTSNVVTITVQPVISNFDIAGNQTVCEGTPVTLIDGQAATGGDGTNYSYVWESSTDNVNWTAISGATGEDYQASGLTTTTYYRRKVTSGQCSATSNVVTVTVNPLATGSITGPAGICQYQTADVQFTATAGTAPYTVVLTITDPSGNTLAPYSTTVTGNSQAIPVLPLNSAAGTWTIALTSITNSNGCVRSLSGTTVSIVVTQTPTVTVNPVAPVCEGTTVTLTANGATDYTWTGPNLTATSGNPVTANPPASATPHTYTVTGSTSGCNAAPVDASVTVNPKPGTPIVQSPVSYCEGALAAPLSATPSGSGNTLTWFTNSSLTGGSATAPIPATTPSGTYYYYVNETTAANCTGDISTITVVITPGLANNTVSANQTLCSGTPSSDITATTPTGGNGTYTYQWQISTDGGTNWSDIAGATSATYNAGTLPSGEARFRRVVTSGLCSNVSNEVTITVLQPVTNININGDQAICEGSPAGLIDGQTPSGTGTFSYTWQSSADNTNWNNISGATGEDYQPGSLSASTWYRRITSNGACADTSNIVKVTVDPLANGTITAVAAAICEYDAGAVNFTPSAGTSPIEISLLVTYPSGYPPATVTSSTSPIPVIAANSPAGTYTISITSIKNSNGCIRTTGFQAPVAIVVLPTPVVSIAPVAPICEGSSTTVTASGATTYAWTGTGLSSTSGETVTVTPAVTSTYTVVGTSNGCNSIPVSTEVVVNPRPTAAFTVVDNNICLDESAVFNNTSTIVSGSITQLRWDFDNGSGFTAFTGNQQTQQYNTFKSYLVKLVVESDKNCISDTAFETVTVNPIPVADFDTPAFVCMPGNQAIFRNKSTVANNASLNSTWNFGDPASGANNTATSTDGSHVYTASSPATVTLTVTSAAGCAHDTSKTFSKFLDKPQITSASVFPDALCQGSPSVFSSTSIAPNSTIDKYIWTFGDGTTADSANPVKTYKDPGSYPVSLVVENAEGCKSDAWQNTVLVYLQPKIDAGLNYIVPVGTTITLNPKVNDSTIQFAWTSASGMGGWTDLRPSFVADHDDIYFLTATGDGGCTMTDSVIVKVLKPFRIPNAFSPNKDGINDVWAIENLKDYPGAVVEVFNRYGQIVHKSVGYTKPWDGTMNGKDLPVGTYYYIIQPKNGFKQITGYVVLLK